MFSKVDSAKRNEFLDSAKAAREERMQRKRQDTAAITIQTHVRSFLVKCRIRRKFSYEIDEMLKIPTNDTQEYKPAFIPAVETFKKIRKFLYIFKEKLDQQKFEYLCKYVLASMDSEITKFAYVTVAMSKNYVLPWIQQLKDILWMCCRYISNLKQEVASDMRLIATCLRMLVTFTSTSGWKIFKGKNGEALRPGLNQLCANIMGHLNNKGLYPALQVLLMKGLARCKPTFKPVTLSAIITIAIRPLITAQFSDKLLSLFLLHILSVPAIVLHISNLSPECLAVLMTHRIFRKSIDLLSNEQSTKIIFNTLEGNYALCLLANLIQLGDAEMEGLVESTANFIFVVTSLLESCQKYVLSKKSNMPHWHPVLGWFSQKTDQSLHEAMPFVVKQLQLLWKIKMIKILFSDLIAHNEHCGKMSDTAVKASPTKNVFKKAFEKASSKQSVPKVALDSPLMMSTFSACALYRTALKTLTQLRLDILAGLSCEDLLLPHIWHFLCELGPQCGMKVFLEVLSATPNVTTHGLFQMLTLACDASCHIITILDDIELYERQKPFKVEQLVTISHFLNQFIFKVIWNHLLDVKSAGHNDVFVLAHSFLMILYERDCRRGYTPPGHWLIKDIKPSTFLLELEKGKAIAEFLLQKVPHIIPHKERVILFRKFVMKEKADLGLTESVCASPQSTLITVHRSRILEDGYRQLAQLSVNNLKGVIRVKFVNEQGLDEAGIDQDGVFKEFLEETINRVFDPSLNLFKVTSEQKLYPSPTSYIQDNHLLLYEFVGRMLAKAVYECIVVEVPFASFFLSQILGHQYNATYSCIDELPSLDADLYKNLTYLKHYEGDVADLDLTFSCDEDVMGKLMTHELVPGGRVISVVNHNRISYIHLMAHFRMRTQIKEQTSAFIRGFKSIVNTQWLTLFSTPELQKLISGDTMDIDLDDLRKHTQYYGGFHSGHRVVNWLWDLLEHDFNANEKGLFLKFVTSCSKPPLLGFAHLEPPFSIRCVEVSDEQDTGDTVGSVLKGFFNIRKKEPVGRLPTSSTCFNLLKLPNYQQKSTLKAKLRYAITSNTGFELS